ncbi:hypothetical protein CCH79_00018705 [Gambusia affinis]|uniref:Tetraspanin n=1 Tax=Gambusia affinis TaxID=33528 RepID=A0A315VXV6_GAMAF|nr:hypothetical protein CCH79_00018705 [Gambusia affinis]
MIQVLHVYVKHTCASGAPASSRISNSGSWCSASTGERAPLTLLRLLGVPGQPQVLRKAVQVAVVQRAAFTLTRRFGDLVGRSRSLQASGRLASAHDARQGPGDRVVTRQSFRSRLWADVGLRSRPSLESRPRVATLLWDFSRLTGRCPAGRMGKLVLVGVRLGSTSSVGGVVISDGDQHCIDSTASTDLVCWIVPLSAAPFSATIGGPISSPGLLSWSASAPFSWVLFLASPPFSSTASTFTKVREMSIAQDTRTVIITVGESRRVRRLADEEVPEGIRRRSQQESGASGVAAEHGTTEEAVRLRRVTAPKPSDRHSGSAGPKHITHPPSSAFHQESPVPLPHQAPPRSNMESIQCREIHRPCFFIAHPISIYIPSPSAGGKPAVHTPTHARTRPHTHTQWLKKAAKRGDIAGGKISDRERQAGKISPEPKQRDASAHLNSRLLVPHEELELETKKHQKTSDTSTAMKPHGRMFEKTETDLGRRQNLTSDVSLTKSATPSPLFESKRRRRSSEPHSRHYCSSHLKDLAFSNMVCGGFTCSKNALCSLNVVYMLVGLLLIGVAVWGKGFGLVSSIHIIGGVIAVGVFLLLIAIVGLVGAIHHHQYMVILFIVFLFQFGVSCSCLAMNRGQQVVLLNSTWGMLNNKTKINLEDQLDCCGLLNVSNSRSQFDEDVRNCKAVLQKKTVYYPYYILQPCTARGGCLSCGDKMLNHATEVLKILGGVGLFFSFSEILGVWLAVRYRNQKDPRANPSAFL